MSHRLRNGFGLGLAIGMLALVGCGGPEEMGAPADLPADMAPERELTSQGWGPVPYAPTYGHVVANSPTQATLTWQDNSFNEEGFNVSYSKSGDRYSIVFQVPANTTSFTTPFALTPGAYYYFSVNAYNANGQSSWTGDSLQMPLQ